MTAGGAIGEWSRYAATIAGWALFHLAWQGAVLLALSRALDPLLARLAPPHRHALAWIALATTALAPLATGLAAHGALAADARWRDAAATAPGAVVIAGEAPAALLFDAAPDVTGWLAAGWACGALARLALVAAGVWRGRALRRTVLAGSGAVGDAAAVWTTAVHTPLVVGVRHPLVLLPAAHAARLRADEWEAVLAHERAHVERRDGAQQLVQRVLEALLWAHPAVWCLGARLRLAREQCCDARAAARTGRPQALARALVRLAETTPAAGGASLGVAAAVGPLRRRVEALLAPVSPRGGPEAALAGLTAAAALLAAGAGVVALAARAAPRSDRLAGAALQAAHVPGRLVTFDARDPHGSFRVRMLNGRVTSAYVAGRRVPGARLRAVRDTLVIAAGAAAPERRLAVDLRGAIRWSPAPSTP